MFDIAVVLLVLTALLAYVNHRFVGLPMTIGVMAIALVLSLALIGLDTLGLGQLHDYEVSLLELFDFPDVLMQGMLSVLLFAGAMHVDLSGLRAYRWQVGLLAVVGTLLSTLIVGFLVYVFLPFVGIELPLIHCLVFGALISPTDPIAVMGILRAAKAPKNLELVISCESLFNDGVGVVVFSMLLATIVLGTPPTPAQVGMLLLHEAGGGIAYGLLLGYVTFRMLKSIDNYKIEVLLTLAAVLGGYSLATRLHVSGPLAMVVAGLVIGNQGRAQAMSDETRAHLDMFWELLDEILNTVLFVLIGMEALIIPYSPNLALAAIGAVLITLLARGLAVGAPVALFNSRFNLPKGTWQVLIWGGLRGGISVALAMSLPLGEERNAVLALTYAVVVFSILVQGMSIGKVVRLATRSSDRDQDQLPSG